MLKLPMRLRYLPYMCVCCNVREQDAREEHNPPCGLTSNASNVFHKTMAAVYIVMEAWMRVQLVSLRAGALEPEGPKDYQDSKFGAGPFSNSSTHNYLSVLDPTAPSV